MVGFGDLERAARTAGAVAGLGLGGITGMGVALVNQDRQAGVNVTLGLAAQLSLAAAGVTLEIHGEENAVSHRPAIFTFNHQSELDVPIMAAVLRHDFTAVAKKELLTNPVFGPMGRFAGVAFIERGDPAKARAALEPVVERLREGISIAVSPEGTRSAELGPFKKGPFHMAMQGQVPLVPVVIRNASEVLPSGSLVKPGRVQVAVLPPVDTSEWTTDRVGQYRDEVRQMYVDTLANWPS
jgi:putative phosphoserine phosphatase / 1-acylglycerol-3-phosphate O-acyltransferase